MQRQHRVLFGPDVVASLQIPMDLHRAQLEYELREKLILLRQRLLADAGDEKRTWHLLLHSFPAFATLFRHALIEQGQPAPATKRDSVKALAATLAFDAAAFEHILDIANTAPIPKNFACRMSPHATWRPWSKLRLLSIKCWMPVDGKAS